MGNCAGTNKRVKQKSGEDVWIESEFVDLSGDETDGCTGANLCIVRVQDGHDETCDETLLGLLRERGKSGGLESGQKVFLAQHDVHSECVQPGESGKQDMQLLLQISDGERGCCFNQLRLGPAGELSRKEEFWRFRLADGGYAIWQGKVVVDDGFDCRGGSMRMQNLQHAPQAVRCEQFADGCSGVFVGDEGVALRHKLVNCSEMCHGGDIHWLVAVGRLNAGGGKGPQVADWLVRQIYKSQHVTPVEMGAMTGDDQSGGCLGDARGGCLDDARGGCLDDARGGCLDDVHDGTLSDARDGTLSDGRGRTLGDGRDGTLSDDELPSLDELFSQKSRSENSADAGNAKAVTPVKKVSVTASPNTDDFFRKRRAKHTVTPTKTPRKRVQSTEIGRPVLRRQTPVFAKLFCRGTFAPALILDHDDTRPGLYVVKYYNGTVERLDRAYILTGDDGDFYTVSVMSLDEVTGCGAVSKEALDRGVVLGWIARHEAELRGLLLGRVSSRRDSVFMTSVLSRSTLNAENRPGPLSPSEHGFLLDHLPMQWLSDVLKDAEMRAAVERRFERADGALEHLLRQYAFLVLVPELTLRIMLERDKTLRTLDDADTRLLHSDGPESMESQIHYLYSKRDMYRWARRESRPVAAVDG